MKDNIEPKGVRFMSTTAVAYELAPGHDLKTYGGTTHLRDGLHINLGDALAEGNGTILTDDPLVIRALQDRADLQAAAQVPEGAKVTSHQLAPTTSEQHQRDTGDVPAIAFPPAADAPISQMELAAAQLRGDVPMPTATEAPASTATDEDLAAAKAKLDDETAKAKTATIPTPPAPPAAAAGQVGPTPTAPVRS